MLAVRNNLMANVAGRNLGAAYDGLSTSVQRLSSGLRINTAGDDAAGLAVRELIRADVATLRQASRNARDGISMLQVAEGTAGMIGDNLIRMRELAEQAATETYSDQQRSAMNGEFLQLRDEISRSAENAEFNDQFLLNPTDSSTINIHIGASGAEEMVEIDPTLLNAAGLGLTHGTVSSTPDRAVSDVDDAAGDWYTWSARAGKMKFSFDLDGEFEIDIDTGRKFSLNEFKDMINTASNEVIEDWNAASTVDNGDGTYSLKVSGYTLGPTNGMTVEEINVEPYGTKPFNGVLETMFTDRIVEAPVDEKTIATATEAREALTAVEEAIKTIDSARSRFGYLSNRLEYADDVLQIQSENLLSAESRISDVDTATEIASMTRKQVLAQAGVSMLTQANAMPEMALRLLENVA